MNPLVQQRASPADDDESGALTGHPGPIRVDGPHLTPALGSYSDRELAGESEQAVADTPPLEAESGYAQGVDHLLLQANQIADHLRQQCVDLDRREQRLHAHLAQLDQERRNVRIWVEQSESQIDEREAALALREQQCAEKIRHGLELEQDLRKLRDDLLVQQHEVDAQRDRFIVDREAQLAELASAREQLDRWIQEARDELEAERVESDSRLEAERTAFQNWLEHERRTQEQDRERMIAEFRQQQTLQDNRIRFQEEHLLRLRSDLEASQTEFRLEQQQAQTQRVEFAAQLERRSGQFARVRELLEARSESLDRERQHLERSRRASSDALRSDQRALQAERTAWEDERNAQQADLRRQQDLLAMHSENLETRRVRLDRLRAELEDSNRKTLELRLAVEEAQSQLCAAVGADVARRQVDEARLVLAEYYRHTRDGLTTQRHEVAEQAAFVREQFELLQDERQSLATWLTERESQLQDRRREVAALEASLDSREQYWRSAADRWATQRSEAEGVIRDLLRQLEGREAT